MIRNGLSRAWREELHGGGEKVGDQANVVDVPLGYPTSVIYLDESGARASGNNFFVVAAAS